ncbi:MAG TPA: acetate--CoA ligase family protein [Syntrophorhabdaceae bacterium]|nr:acetate--CoA ligase family protein [Syntrophorhabdaceae bacterium]HQM81752.1 acetate--CoA ligase family protein [Syntrophorhabdaceae bacterium]
MERLLLGTDALDFLEKDGFPVLGNALARDEKEAVTKASQIGFPVALKVSSPDVVHKTETGGIMVALKDGGEVKEAFKKITGAFLSNHPGKRLEGVIVQKMGGGLELIVGVAKDQQFGPVLMFGLGGIFVEAMKDVSFRCIPIAARDAKEMIEELKSYSVLTNRRKETIDLSLIEDLLLQISRLVEKHPGIREMDLNPVFVSSGGISVCDVRIKMGQ